MDWIILLHFLKLLYVTNILKKYENIERCKFNSLLTSDILIFVKYQM